MRKRKGVGTGPSCDLLGEASDLITKREHLASFGSAVLHCLAFPGKPCFEDFTLTLRRQVSSPEPMDSALATMPASPAMSTK
jgi:hypothetical protein